MLCKVAELFFEVPEEPSLTRLCQDYRYDGEPDGEVYTMRKDLHYKERWVNTTREMAYYQETGHEFGLELVKHAGVRVHASAVAWQGKAYLFSAPCGTGKSTHTKLWQQLYGEDVAVIFNDDKPAVRFIDGKWFAYGTPWCGKDHINKNIKVPIAGLCFLARGTENKIRRLSPNEAFLKIMSQTIWREHSKESMNMLLETIEKMLTQVPVFELECLPDVDAARLSSETMSKAADEAGM